MSRIALFGFINSGKNTAAESLRVMGYQDYAFASKVKDCLSIIFGWPRNLLEGDTIESRKFRDTVDEWWSDKLGIKNFTPRVALQLFATDTMRNHLDQSIWIHSLEKEIGELDSKNVIINDVRFHNEIEFIEKLNFKKVLISRGPKPNWHTDGVMAANGDVDAIHRMKYMHRIHESEWSWLGTEFDYHIKNDSTVEDLTKEIESYEKSIR